jgi:hypothetical protein
MGHEDTERKKRDHGQVPGPADVRQRVSYPDHETRELPPGFCAAIPDLAVAVRPNGWVRAANGYEGKIGVVDDEMLLVLGVFRDGLPHFGLPVVKLIASAFGDLEYDCIKSVGYRNGDPSDCGWDNLDPEVVERPAGEQDDAEARASALEEGQRLAWEAVYCDEDHNLFQYEAIVTFS